MPFESSPTDQDRKLASAIYSHFSAQPGAEHIATEFALTHLSALVSKTRPRRVLEIGAGIGTITRLLLDHPSHIERVVSTEDNAFCQDALRTHVGNVHGNRWELVQDPDEAPAGAYDLVIFDGYAGVEKVYPRLAEGTYCFVEGIRQPIRDGLNQYLVGLGLACEFTSYIRPKRFRFSRNRKWLGLIPKIKYRTNKGCHIGRVELAPQRTSTPDVGRLDPGGAAAVT